MSAKFMGVTVKILPFLRIESQESNRNKAWELRVGVELKKWLGVRVRVKIKLILLRLCNLL